MSAEKSLRQDEELAFDVAIDEPPQKLWRALTEAPIVERWLAPVIDRSREPGNAEEQFTCQLIESEKNRSASYIWRDPEAGSSIVTFSISERSDGFSRLSIVHKGLPRVFTIAAAETGTATNMRFAARTTLPSAANGNGVQNTFAPLLLAA